MDSQKLNKWAELLLDTGKRNNLIHFKDTKMGSVEILSPDFVTLFNRAEHSAVFEVYDPKLEDEEEEFDFVEEETEENRNDISSRYVKRFCNGRVEMRPWFGYRSQNQGAFGWVS